MTEVIGEFLPFAVGIAVSPLPIAAIILMLLSTRAGANSAAFLAGWVAGLAGVGIVVIALGDSVGTDSGEASDTTGWIKLVLGVLLLGLAVRSWITRPGPDDEPEVPTWMAALDSVTPLRSFGLAVLLSAVNPKNLILDIGGASVIAASDLSGGEQALALALFVAIAASTVAAPAIVYVTMSDRADRLLGGLKDWLIGNNQTVMMVLFAIFGAKLVGDGIAILS